MEIEKHVSLECNEKYSKAIDSLKTDIRIHYDWPIPGWVIA